ncbi:hypothetical protein SELMODRAFT_413139 [Selaginella moellendorffii]|uniref:Bulb-type lectin domain-containing protein n=1 Tax=Selaginella moellendorffii TaxID=88036 RepID=D8RNH0_SELML|nr:hypothetical protein SELMODRAFT_413139 [Selaginella moellendorffii]
MRLKALYLVLLQIFCLSRCSCMRFDEASIPGRLNLQQVVIMEIRIRSFIRTNIQPDIFYNSQSWGETLQIDTDNFCIVRLTLFTMESDGSCSLGPSPMRLRGSSLIQISNYLVDRIGEAARMYGYGRIMAVSGLLSIDYRIYSTSLPQATHISQPLEIVLNINPSNSTLNSTRELYGQNECYAFRSGMVSGERGALGSDLYSGSRLVSPNGFYELVLKNDCNLVLLAMGWKELWSSSTAGKGVRCVLTLQRDGNLVLLGGDGRVDPFQSIVPPGLCFSYGDGHESGQAMNKSFLIQLIPQQEKSSKLQRLSTVIMRSIECLVPGCSQRVWDPQAMGPGFRIGFITRSKISEIENALMSM